MTHTDSLLLILAILGGLDLSVRALNWISSLFPRIFSYQLKFLRVVGEIYTISAFRKREIAIHIEETLNQSVFNFQQYLPKGWLKRARINWVRNPQTARISDGEIILRVRPEKNNDLALIRSIWTYFDSALFPDTRDVLPDGLLSGISLAITRAGLGDNHSYLLKTFDDEFLPQIVSERTSILAYFGDCIRLNEYGFLMGPFLREVDHVAAKSRFNSGRDKISEVTRGILDHMLSFQPLANPHKTDDEWIFQRPFCSYGFLLVSKPPDMRPGIEAYVRRVKQKVQRNVERIYLIGRREEKDFVTDVIESLLSIRELRGIEFFHLFRDYRGDPGGIGAILGLDEILGKLRPPQRNIENILESLQDPLIGATPPDEGPMELNVSPKNDLEKIAEDLIVRLSDYEGEWISLAELGTELRKNMPGFTPQLYGGRNLVSVLRRLDNLEFDERGPGPAKVVYVRMRSEATAASNPKPTQMLSTADKKIIEILGHCNNPGGWMFLGQLGGLLRKELPEIDYSSLGYTSFHDLVSRIPDLEIDERGDGHSKTYIRLRPAPQFKNYRSASDPGRQSYI